MRRAPLWFLSLEGVRRFADPAYSYLTLRMRRGEAPGDVFDDLVARGETVVHASEAEWTLALAAVASRQDGLLVVADTREHVAAINGVVRGRAIAGRRFGSDR